MLELRVIKEFNLYEVRAKLPPLPPMAPAPLPIKHLACRTKFLLTRMRCLFLVTMLLYVGKEVLGLFVGLNLFYKVPAVLNIK